MSVVTKSNWIAAVWANNSPKVVICQYVPRCCILHVIAYWTTELFLCLTRWKWGWWLQPPGCNVSSSHFCRPQIRPGLILVPNVSCHAHITCLLADFSISRWAGRGRIITANKAAGAVWVTTLDIFRNTCKHIRFLRRAADMYSVSRARGHKNRDFNPNHDVF